MAAFSLMSKPLEPRSSRHPASAVAASIPTNHAYPRWIMHPPKLERRGRDQDVEESAPRVRALGELFSNGGQRAIDALLDRRQLLGIDVQVVIAEIRTRLDVRQHEFVEQPFDEQGAKLERQRAPFVDALRH